MLYIVSTPIGNMQDITLRAITTLEKVDEVICEDTRVTGGLLKHFNISKKLTPLNDFNEDQLIPQVIAKLEKGLHLALVSDAGTPLISDPGFRLVREVKKRSLPVTSIPGVSSVISALTLSTLPPDKFMFIGFLPKGIEKKKNVLEKLKTSLMVLDSNKLSPTVIYFESPHSLLDSLEALEATFGDIEVVVTREITKIYEEVVRLPTSQLKKHFAEKKPKGEFVILFNPKATL